MEKNFVKVKINGAVYEAPVGSLLSELPVFDNKLEMPCGGRGSCGKCRVRVQGEVSPASERERELLTSSELSEGVRLACMCRVLGDTQVSLDSEGASFVTLDARLPEFEISCDFEGYGLAIDLGSTTLAGAICSNRGETVSIRGMKNPQTAFGADVITRMEKAVNGKAEQLARITLDAIEELARLLAADVGVKEDQISLAVITGNTAMLSLLTKTETDTMCKAPFRARRLFGEYLSGKELGFKGACQGARIYLPSCISAFVGADTVCALLCSGLCDGQDSGMLTDIGTNGETALWQSGILSVCSSAAGPAFEGAGISCGTWSRQGAIDKVSLVNGTLYPHVIGEGRALGICGAGVIDALACLMDIDELDESGHLENGEVTIAPGVSLTQGDVYQITLAKAAIRAGIDTLLEKKRMSTEDLSSFYICGGFGSHMNIHSAEKTGLLPCGISKIATVLGNGALAGAVMMLLNGEYREKGSVMAQNAEHVSLSGDNSFFERYIENMFYIKKGM